MPENIWYTLLSNKRIELALANVYRLYIALSVLGFDLHLQLFLLNGPLKNRPPEYLTVLFNLLRISRINVPC